MATLRSRNLPGNRMARGNAILEAAKQVDTSVVKTRMSAFATAHRRYAAAQQRADVAEARLRKKQAQLAQRDREQDHAVEQLACELAHKGQSRNTPFAAFGALSPSVIKALPYVEEAKAIHALVAAMQRSSMLFPAATLKVVEAADQAARAVEIAAAPIDALERSVEQLRRSRDTLGESWDATLAALKRGARAAFDEGAPTLYTTLFGRPIRVSKKAAPQPTPPVTPAQPAAVPEAAAPAAKAA